MTTTTLLAASDAMIRENNPTGRYGGQGVMSVSGLTAGRRYALLYFNQPFPSGVTILSATLRLYQSGVAAGGSRVLTVHRLTGPFVESQVSWSNRPGTSGSASSAAQGNGGVSGREWSINVTALMQTIADGGAPWYGLAVLTTNTGFLNLFSRESEDWAPTLEVTWSDAPSAPTDLAPSASRSVSVARPTLRFGYTDISGDTSLNGIQVQVNTSNSFTSPAIDSGQIAATEPEWKLTSDLTNGTTYYWRARVQDGAGLWSDWSETAVFVRTAKPTVAITNPAVDGDPVYTTTPTFSWTVSGGTQSAYQVFVTDPDDTSEVVMQSSKHSDGNLFYTVPQSARLLLTPGADYRLVVRVWDTVARESIPEESVYVDTVRTFTVGTTSATAGVTDLIVVPPADSASPFLTLEWKRSSAPSDGFAIILAGKLVAIVDADDAFVSGTTYRYVVRGIPPRSPQTLGVAAKVGTSTSDISTVVGSAQPEGVWLYDLAGGAAICIAGVPDPEGMISSEASEDTTIFKPVGSANPVMISMAVRGPEGEVNGTIKVADLAAWNTLTARRAVTLGLTRVDLATKVQIFNTVRDHADEFGHGDIPVSFSYVTIR